MQPPQNPGPYPGQPYPGPPYPGAQGPPPPPGGFPPPPQGPPGVPPRKSGRGPLLAILIVGFLVVAVGGGVFIYVNNAKSKGRFKRQPAACSLLSQAQVQAYLPGATSSSALEGSDCTWEAPADSSDGTGEMHVYLDTSDGETINDAKDQYNIRRRQDDQPGTTITPLSLGEESFMACKTPTKGDAASCETYTRVSNVVLKVDYESYPVQNAHDPASSVRALATQAVQHLNQSA